MDHIVYESELWKWYSHISVIQWSGQIDENYSTEVTATITVKTISGFLNFVIM